MCGEHGVAEMSLETPAKLSIYPVTCLLRSAIIVENIVVDCNFFLVVMYVVTISSNYCS